jgi:hypothetical protein
LFMFITVSVVAFMLVWLLLLKIFIDSEYEV